MLLNNTALQSTLPTYRSFHTPSFSSVLTFVDMLSDRFSCFLWSWVFLMDVRRRAHCAHKSLFLERAMQFTFSSTGREFIHKSQMAVVLCIPNMTAYSSLACKAEGITLVWFVRSISRFLENVPFKVFVCENIICPAQRKSLLGIFPLFLTQSYSAFLTMRYKTAKFIKYNISALAQYLLKFPPKLLVTVSGGSQVFPTTVVCPDASSFRQSREQDFYLKTQAPLNLFYACWSLVWWKSVVLSKHGKFLFVVFNRWQSLCLYSAMC